MEYKSNKQSSDGNYEIDLIQLLLVLLKKMWAIILVAIIFGAGFLGVTKYVITPKYQSSFSAYVNNKSAYQEENSQTLSSSDIYASQSLVYTYSKIIESRSVLMAANEKLEKNYSYAQLKSMVITSVQDETEIISVQVITEDAKEAEMIAVAIATVAPDIVARIVEGSSMQIVDQPVYSNVIYSPSYLRYTMLGALLGAVLMAAIIILKSIFNDRINSEDVLEEKYGIPVVGVIPDIDSISNKNNYYSNNKIEQKKEK